MKIGTINIDTPIILAPMAGYTDRAFRTICKENGADIMYTEFVSSEGLVRGSEKTETYLDFDDMERPLGIQIFGHDPAAMANSAKFVAHKFQPDIIDMNMGCPVKKVVKKEAGSALLKNLPLLKEITNAVVNAVDIPVTGKIRSGWNHQQYVYTEAAKILEGEGAAAMTIHPRTASDMYKNTPNLSHIAAVKQAVSIPVIGNGDILTPLDAKAILDETGCDGVMIGRGALGNPWIFNQTKHFINTGELLPEKTVDERIQMCLRLLDMEAELKTPEFANKILRKFYGWYLRGFSGASQIRKTLVEFKTCSASRDYLESIIGKYSIF